MFTLSRYKDASGKFEYTVEDDMAATGRVMIKTMELPGKIAVQTDWIN